MSTAMNSTTSESLAPLEIAGGPGARVPSLDEVYRLTEVPDCRVVFRGVDWDFYVRLVDSIPPSSNIHADYDGRDMEVMAKGRKHERISRRLDLVIVIVADEWDIAYSGLDETTWKRPGVSRGLEADRAYYFLPEKLSQEAAASEAGSDDVADYPDPDLAVEVDISRPQVDRAGIYASLRVAEVWRFDEGRVTIERLTAEGTYAAVESSGFLPIRAEDVLGWALGGPALERDWLRWARAEIRRRHEQGR